MITGREIRGVLVRVVANLVVFLRSCVVNVVREGMTLAAISDARVCAIMPPRVCA
jgi:hypothetical protein